MIEGQLVRLRAREPGDAERAFGWINDWEVARFLLVRYPLSLASERIWVEATPAASFGGVHLAIDTLDGRHIGNLDLRNVMPENRTAELGIMIGDKQFWGRGYGADAVRTVARLAFHRMNLNRLYLHTYAYNERAQRSFARAGFTLEGRLRNHLFVDGRYWDVLVMGLLREEFDAQEQTAGAGA